MLIGIESANRQTSDAIYFSLRDTRSHTFISVINWFILSMTLYIQENRYPLSMIIKLISNRTIRDSPLFMSSFQPVDFRCGIIRLTALPISLSTIDRRRLLRLKIDVDYRAQWQPPSLLHPSVSSFPCLSSLSFDWSFISRDNSIMTYTHDLLLHAAKLINIIHYNQITRKDFVYSNYTLLFI